MSFSNINSYSQWGELPTHAKQVSLWFPCRPGLAVTVWMTIFLLIFQETVFPFPSWVQKCVLFAFLLVLGFRIWKFQRWHDELPWLRQFVLSFVVLFIELLVENMMVWAVSAFDGRKNELVPALQDNIHLIFDSLYDDRPWLKTLCYAHLGDTLWFLSFALMLAFSVAWDQLPYSGFGIMSRYCWTIFWSRCIRTASFSLTVVPSPRPGCYKERFPQPPNEWVPWLMVGFERLRGAGGCNDLIFSGHCSFWVMTVLIYRDFYRQRSLVGRALYLMLWFLLIHTAVRDVLNNQHYSVDMFLGVVVTWLVWLKTKRMYHPRQHRIMTCVHSSKEQLPKLAFIVISIALAACAYLIFGANA